MDKMEVCASVSPKDERHPAKLDGSFHFKVLIDTDIIFLSTSLSRRSRHPIESSGVHALLPEFFPSLLGYLYAQVYINHNDTPHSLMVSRIPYSLFVGQVLL
jgi:hypothetical protein